MFTSQLAIFTIYRSISYPESSAFWSAGECLQRLWDKIMDSIFPENLGSGLIANALV